MHADIHEAGLCGYLPANMGALCFCKNARRHNSLRWHHDLHGCQLLPPSYTWFLMHVLEVVVRSRDQARSGRCLGPTAMYQDIVGPGDSVLMHVLEVRPRHRDEVGDEMFVSADFF